MWVSLSATFIPKFGIQTVSQLVQSLCRIGMNADDCIAMSKIKFSENDFLQLIVVKWKSISLFCEKCFITSYLNGVCFLWMILCVCVCAGDRKWLIEIISILCVCACLSHLFTNLRRLRIPLSFFTVLFNRLSFYLLSFLILTISS